MRKSNLYAATAGLLLLCISSSLGEIRLASVFRNSMVLQRNAENRIYGFATTENQVSITFKDKRYIAPVHAGKWECMIPVGRAGGPYTLTVQGTNTVVLNDILSGDVWFCSGQSNMQAPINSLIGKYASIIQPDIKGIESGMIRFYTVNPNAKDEPQADSVAASYIDDAWLKLDEENIGYCSAVAAFFADRMYKETGVPIGLIIAARGGSPAEAWVPRSVLVSKPVYGSILEKYQRAVDTWPQKKIAYDKAMEEWKEAHDVETDDLFSLPWSLHKTAPETPYGPIHHFRPAGLFNGMVHPFVRHAVKGVIWYQGESSAGSYDRSYQYRFLFKDLIQCWRKAWGTDLPFLFCQLASFKSYTEEPGGNDHWPWLREAQKTALELNGTGMAVLIDSGVQEDIHPPYKKNAGDRLARLALAEVYEKTTHAQGPQFKSMEIDNNLITIAFDHVGEGLETRARKMWDHEVQAGAALSFLTCDVSGKWVRARAKITGPDTVVVESPVDNPIAVRYAWENFPKVNLYNAAGLPAEPFRTDDFPVPGNEPSAWHGE